MPKRSYQELKILQQRAADLYSEGHTLREIAEILGVTQRTISRWKVPLHEIRKALPSADAEAESIQQAVAEIVAPAEIEVDENATEEIAQSLTEIMQSKVLPEIIRILDSEHTSATNRLKACSLVGDWAGWGAWC